LLGFRARGEDGGRRAERVGRRTETVDRRTESVGRRTETVGRRTESVGRRTATVGRATDIASQRPESVGRVTDIASQRTEGVGRTADIASQRPESVERATVQDKPGGSGLGLMVARTMIEEVHDGSLTFESQRGAGTCMILVVPARRAGARGQERSMQDAKCVVLLRLVAAREKSAEGWPSREELGLESGKPGCDDATERAFELFPRCGGP
jgi:hypothetical protein